MIVDFFDEIVVINLLSRTDRRREMEREFARIGIRLPHERVRFFPAIRPTDRGEFPSVGARGCFLSQLTVIEEAAAKGMRRLLICEDDLAFSKDFGSRAGGILSALVATEWCFFYGGHRLRGAMPDGGSLRTVPPDIAIETAHFLGINGRRLPELGRYLRLFLDRPASHPEGAPMHVDGAYHHFRMDHPQERALVAVPELGYQRSSRSDIAENRWFDRLPVISDAAWIARKVKQRLV